MLEQAGTIEWYDANTLVLRTSDPERLKGHFEALGLTFQGERHGKGPFHHSCQVGAKVVEIYPARKEPTK